MAVGNLERGGCGSGLGYCRNSLLLSLSMAGGILKEGAVVMV